MAAAGSLGAGLFVSAVVSSAIAIIGSRAPVQDPSLHPLILGSS